MKLKLNFLITKNSPGSSVRRLNSAKWFVSFAFILFSVGAWGQTFFTAGPEALGDAGRAANVALDAHYLNPAALAFSKTDTNLGGVFQESAVSTDSPTNNYAFIITDNDPDKFAAGSFAYLRKRISLPDDTIIENDLSIDMATHIFPTLSVGLQGHQLRYSSASRSWTKYNGTLGVLAVPRPWFGLAFVAYDMFNDSDLDLVPTLSLGTNFIIMDIFHLRADVSRPQKKNPENAGILNLGGEFDLTNGFLLRAGGIWDQVAHQSYWTLGASFEGPNLSIAYAYKANNVVDSDITQTIQAWLQF